MSNRNKYSEQVKELKRIADTFHEWEYSRFYDVISRAADTIESLSVKLEAANMERSSEHTTSDIECLAHECVKALEKLEEKLDIGGTHENS